MSGLSVCLLAGSAVHNCTISLHICCLRLCPCRVVRRVVVKYLV